MNNDSGGKAASDVLISAETAERRAKLSWIAHQHLDKLGKLPLRDRGLVIGAMLMTFVITEVSRDEWLATFEAITQEARAALVELERLV